MQKSTVPDEIDLAIFHALELAPRASWTTVGAAVGIDAATAARRWEAMRAANRAYITSYPLFTREGRGAFVEIACRADRVRDVASRVARDSHALRVDIVSGRSSIFVVTVATSAAGLNSFILDRLPRIPNVERVVAHPVVAVHAEGGFAAAGALSRSARRILPKPRRGTIVPSAVPVDDLDWRICVELARDGRASIAQLSRTTGAPPSTVARRLRRLDAEGALRVRALLAPSASVGGVLVWLGVRVPPVGVSEVVRTIARFAGVISVSLVAGDYNLFVEVALPHLAALEPFEASVQRADPEIRIVARMVVLHHVRQLSRIFDAQGDVAEIASIDLR
ncbi:Lrp/AsnC family transcriptional regulator [Microbacterium sp. RURRCA19A]|uniref:Lrp/AsnC family transcriptional regulator n=1 Tax=Microbacterium sp. RURRCA19A TaxID=1907391 RepID=UPI000955EA48|nr:AsnC family transcriptional regulator [Microbacterium sp. RURRCA19A]SIR93775.1 DNA-binding transcriptional regulator, Lrp family [Microbacterium sp. RURRCA19A]